MMRRIARRLRAFWHRRELRWAMAELGVDNLDQLAALCDRPLSPAQARFLETRERILARRNPARLIEDALWCERIGRVAEAVMGTR